VRRVCRGTPLLHGLGPEAILAHQPGHAMLPNPLPTSHKRLPDARTAVGLATALVEHSDGCKPRTIGGRPPTLRTRPPRVLPRGGYG
jgi:hypothetical protein